MRVPQTVWQEFVLASRTLGIALQADEGRYQKALDPLMVALARQCARLLGLRAKLGPAVYVATAWDWR